MGIFEVINAAKELAGKLVSQIPASSMACMEDLPGTDLRSVGMEGRDLDLSGADLRGALVDGTILYGTCLSMADIRGSELMGLVIRDAAALNGADIRGAANVPCFAAAMG